MSPAKNAVETVIERRLAPLFDLDGGSVAVLEVDVGRGEIIVRFDGSYRACPSRNVILERVLEPTLRNELSWVSRVRMG